MSCEKLFVSFVSQIYWKVSMMILLVPWLLQCPLERNLLHYLMKHLLHLPLPLLLLCLMLGADLTHQVRDRPLYLSPLSSLCTSSGSQLYSAKTGSSPAPPSSPAVSNVGSRLNTPSKGSSFVPLSSLFSLYV